VASSARPAAAFWREKFLAAICSTREVERKETAMVASSAVIRRVRMRALPEEEGLTTEDTESTELDIKRLALLCFDLIPGFIARQG
jgi:hypothetical protein